MFQNVNSVFIRKLRNLNYYFDVWSVINYETKFKLHTFHTERASIALSANSKISKFVYHYSRKNKIKNPVRYT